MSEENKVTLEDVKTNNTDAEDENKSISESVFDTEKFIKHDESTFEVVDNGSDTSVCIIQGILQKFGVRYTVDPYITKENQFKQELSKLSEEQLNFLWEKHKEAWKTSYEKRKGLPSPEPALKENFKFLKLIGKGSYGYVILCKRKYGTYHAAKLMKKYDLIKNHILKHARNERRILECIRCKFAVKLDFFFQDNIYIYFILPFISGGELFTYLSIKNRLKEDHAKFYISQIVMAFEYLHLVDLIYRDLKPENILITSTGYLKITDFGFCKEVKERTYTFCGTTEYLAPELIHYRGYSKSVDWWTVGILTYELCAGFSPFRAENMRKIFDNISRCKYRIPTIFSNKLKDFLKNILTTDLSKRLGVLKNGANDVKEHPWLAEQPWISIYRGYVVAPYVPIVRREDDTANFDSRSNFNIEEDNVDQYAAEFKDF